MCVHGCLIEDRLSCGGALLRCADKNLQRRRRCASRLTNITTRTSTRRTRGDHFFSCSPFRRALAPQAHPGRVGSARCSRKSPLLNFHEHDDRRTRVQIHRLNEAKVHEISSPRYAQRIRGRTRSAYRLQKRPAKKLKRPTRAGQGNGVADPWLNFAFNLKTGRLELFGCDN